MRSILGGLITMLMTVAAFAQTGTVTLGHLHNQARISWANVPNRADSSTQITGIGAQQLTTLTSGPITVSILNGTLEVGGGEGFGVRNLVQPGSNNKTIDANESLIVSTTDANLFANEYTFGMRASANNEVSGMAIFKNNGSVLDTIIITKPAGTNVQQFTLNLPDGNGGKLLFNEVEFQSISSGGFSLRNSTLTVLSGPTFTPIVVGGCTFNQNDLPANLDTIVAIAPMTFKTYAKVHYIAAGHLTNGRPAMWEIDTVNCTFLGFRGGPELRNSAHSGLQYNRNWSWHVTGIAPDGSKVFLDAINSGYVVTGGQCAAVRAPDVPANTVVPISFTPGVEFYGRIFNATLNYECNVLSANCGNGYIYGCASTPANPLIANYKFDDCGQDLGIDSEGNFSGVEVDSPSQSLGQVGKAASFDGTNDYIDINNTLMTATDLQDGFTMAAWINVNDNSSGKTIFSLLDRNGLDEDGDIVLRVNQFEELALWWYDGGTRNILRNFNFSFVPGNWYHVAVQYTGTDFVLYIDGTEVERTAATLSSVTPNSMFIGATTDPNFNFTGSIDDVRVYNEAIDSVAIEALANMSLTLPSCFTPIALHYAFDDCDATNFGLDSEGNFNANVIGNPFATEGQINQAAFINNTPSYLDVNATVMPAGDLQDGFTLAAWVNPLDDENGKTIVSLIDRNSNNADGDIVLRLNHSEELAIWWYTNGNRNILRNFGDTLTPGEWSHVAAQYTGTEMVLYINGVEVERGPANLSSISPNSLYVGATNDPAHYFFGKLDEVKVFNTIIDSVDIAALANATASPVSCITPFMAQYQFDDCDNTGNLGIDSQGNYDATLQGTPAQVQGYLGQALSFTPTADYLTIDPAMLSNMNLQTGFTIASWVNANSNVLGKTILGFANSNGARSDGDITFRINFEGELVIWWFENGNQNILRNFGNVLAPNSWNHVAATFTGAEMVLYVNGNEVERAPATLSNVAPNAAYIGSSNEATFNFDGLLDDVRIYNTPQHDSVIAQLAGATTVLDICNTTFLAHYEMDDCNGDQGVDSRGNYPAVTFGAPAPITGYTGAALSFDGIEDYLEVNQMVMSAADLQDGFTFAAWIQAKDNNEGKTIVGMVDRTGLEADGDILFRVNNQEQLVIWWYEGGVQNVLRHDPVIFAPNTWYHVAAQYDGTDMILYINGVEVERAAATLASVNTNTMYIGGSNWNIHTYYGLLDDVRVYSEAIDPADIAALAATTEAGVTCCPTTILNPVTYHKLNHCSGDTSVDQTGNFGGTAFGNLLWQEGYDEQTMLFDTLSFIRVDTTPLSAVQMRDGFAVAAWFQVEDNATGKTILSFARRDTAEVDGEFALRVNNNEQLVAWWYNGGQNVLRYDPVILSTGQWYHAAVVYDGTSLILYLNGNEVTKVVADLANEDTDVMYIGRGNRLLTSNLNNSGGNGGINSVRNGTISGVLPASPLSPPGTNQNLNNFTISNYSSLINIQTGAGRPSSGSINNPITSVPTPNQTVFNYPFYGLLDEVMVFDDALQACEVLELAALAPNPVACAPVVVRQRRTTDNETSLELEEQNLISAFTVYPNPATNVVKIDVPAGAENVNMAVFSLDGKQVMNRSSVETQSTIDIAELTPGMYLVQITMNDVVENFKLIKK